MSEVFNIIAYVKARVDEAKRGFSELKQSVRESSDQLTQLGSAGEVAAGILIQQFSQKVVAAFETFGRVTVDAAAGFELATARIIAASGKTGDEADDLIAVMEDATMSLGVEFGGGATDAMQAMEALVKAGLDPATEATLALRGVLQLATIEQIAAADAANMVVAAMAQYGLTAGEATRIVDGFVKASAAGIDTAAGYAAGLANVGATASSMGFSIEETLAALVQIDASQKDARKSGTFLNRMFIDLASKSEDAGIAIYSADGGMRSMDEIVGELRTKIQGFSGDQAALNEWLGQFQSLSQRAILSLVSYDGTIEETVDQLVTMAGAQDQSNVILETYTGQLSIAQAKQEEAAIGMGKLTTQLSIMSKEFWASLGPVGLLAESLGPPMLSGAMQGLTIVFLPMLMKTLGQMVFQMGVATTATTILGGALKIMTGPIGWVMAAIGALGLAWSQNWGGIQEKTKVVIDFIMEKIKWVTDGIKAFGDSVSDTLNWIGDRWKDLTQIIGGELDDQKEALASALDEETDAIKSSYAEQVDAIKDSLAERQTALSDAMSSQLDTAKGHYESLKSTTEEAYATALEEAQKHWTDLISGTAEGWEGVVHEYESHYDGIVSDTEAHYGDLISSANEHSAQLLSDTTQSFDDQLSETGAFYDNMLAEQKGFLIAIREGRRSDLDDLELAHLLEKQLLKEKFEGGLWSQKKYEEKLSELENDYRKTRSDIRDDYRIQELQAEEEFRTEEERINDERAAKLEGIEDDKASELTSIEEDLQNTVEGIEQEKADEITRINEERVTKLEEIRAEEAAMEVAHAAELEKLAEESEAERLRIQEEANEEKARLADEHHDAMLDAEKKYLDDLSAAEKEFIEESLDSWSNYWGTPGYGTMPGVGFGGLNPDVEAQHGFDGWVDRPTRFLAGEAGREHVKVTPAGASQTGGKMDIRINVTLPTTQTGEQARHLAREFADEAVIELRRRGAIK